MSLGRGSLHKTTKSDYNKGAGFDVVVVCGFAFDAHAGETAREFSPDEPEKRDGFVAEETRQYGKLPVLLARMNPDLAMGDELLKKTGAGNLFRVFGEPDVDIRKQDDGKVVMEIRGVDVYDPTTGQIRSSSTDDIACWFIDTNYNEESFFVRHAYFTGAEEPYEKLKRALRADVDEAAWSSLYSTVSRPFDPPLVMGLIWPDRARHFAECCGIDISPKMIELAEWLNPSLGNCRFVTNANDDLRVVPASYFDRIYTINVLQHMSTRAQIESYLAEFVRTLKAGGLLVAQLPAGVPLWHRIRLTLSSAAYASLRKLGVNERFVYETLRLSPIRMNSIREGEVVAYLESLGASVLRVEKRTEIGLPQSRAYFVTK